MRSARCCTGDVGPQMWMSSAGANSGRKNPRPCRWSRCRCVSRMCSSTGRSSCIDTPSGRMPGTGVEHEHVPAVEAHLDTRRVAAVLDGVGTRRRDRPSTPPHAGAHQSVVSPVASSQNTATTPCISPFAPSNGYAVASYVASHAVVRGGDEPSCARAGARRTRCRTASRAGESAHRRASRAAARRRTHRRGSRRARRTACRAAAPPRRCRRRACRRRRSGTSASRGSTRARAPGSTAGSWASPACPASHSRRAVPSSLLVHTEHIVAASDRVSPTHAPPPAPHAGRVGTGTSSPLCTSKMKPPTCEVGRQQRARRDELHVAAQRRPADRCWPGSPSPRRRRRGSPPIRARSSSSVVPTIAQSVCCTMQTRVTPSRFTASTSERSASAVTRAPALRMIFASPARNPSSARGSMRESMHVSTARPLAATPATPESWNSRR